MTTVILFLIAFLPRLILANQSLWLDEASTFGQAALPISQFFQAIKADIHPPLSFLILHFWIPLAGKTEWLIRLPNILFGAATIPVLYLLLTVIPAKAGIYLNRSPIKSGMTLPLLAALLLAINPLHIYYSQELRMYSLNVLLTVLSWLLLLKWFKGKNSKHFAVGYLLVSIANLYTFYGSVFNLIAQWVFVFWQFPKKVKPFTISNLLLAIFFLPWLPTFITQLQAGNYLTKALPGWSAVSGTLSIKSIGLIFAKFTLGRISFADKTFYSLFVFSVILYFILALVVSYHKFKPKLLISWMLVPL
ncbi:glycosyltransferase family 39 protein, partial [Candidatus Curtissbacteria bacterium]|nr:glycosyltransferase family 39 protein [Candidatus Curtissbacteria bacterium]